jgi:hypothetical protein
MATSGRSPSGMGSLDAIYIENRVLLSVMSLDYRHDDTIECTSTETLYQANTWR